MKLSWTNLKISIAGAKLSHLSQKDKVWDPGSMTEQARIIFYLVQKAKNSGSIESLGKYLTVTCYNSITKEWEALWRDNLYREKTEWVIREISVLSVRPGNGKKPDEFTAYLGCYRSSVCSAGTANERNVCLMKWSFQRQGNWWMLDRIRGL